MNSGLWGISVECLILSIAIDAHLYYIGEPVRLHIKLNNIGNEALPIVVRPGLAMFAIEIRKDNRRLQLSRSGMAMAEVAARGRRSQIDLPPGAVRLFDVTVSDAFEILEPGKYEVVVLYGIYRRGTFDEYATLRSNEVVIDVI